MQTVFDQLAGMQYFSKLDLLKGFNQIPVEMKSRELMAVSTPAGLYQPTVMPFGVKNAPGSFQREMRRVLQGRLNKGVYVFIDDIIVYSRTVTRRCAASTSKVVKECISRKRKNKTTYDTRMNNKVE